MTSGTGTCSVIANQAGNANYSAAAQVTQTTNATQASQTITFTTNAPASAAYGTNFTVAATGGASGNSLVFTSAGSCSNSGATYTMTSGTGTCSVIANQAGNTNYSAATQVTETTNATLASQTITFTTPAPASAGYGNSFTVAANGGASGNCGGLHQQRIVQQLGHDLHHDQRHGDLLGDRESGGEQQLRGGSAGDGDDDGDSGDFEQALVPVRIRQCTASR